MTREATVPLLPPSERDLEVYESVRIAGVSLRAAAAQFGISVTRVRQLVNRVIEWLAESLPPETDLSRQQQLQLARHLAADRLNHAYGQLMDLWRETQDTSYLLKTTRLSLALARLGVVPGAIEGHLADAWDAADPESSTHTPCAVQQSPIQNPQSKIQNSPPPPPPRDCAPASKPRPTPPAPLPASSDANIFSHHHLSAGPDAMPHRLANLAADLRAAASPQQLPQLLGTIDPATFPGAISGGQPCAVSPR